MTLHPCCPSVPELVIKHPGNIFSGSVVQSIVWHNDRQITQVLKFCLRICLSLNPKDPHTELWDRKTEETKLQLEKSIPNEQSIIEYLCKTDRDFKILISKETFMPKTCQLLTNETYKRNTTIHSTAKVTSYCLLDTLAT